MIEVEDRVAQLLATHIESSITLADQLAGQIVQAGLNMAERLLADGKVLLCAHGRAFANGLHFAHALLRREGVERPPLPVVMLGADTALLQMALSEHQEDQVYAREIQALGHAQDILLVLATAGVTPALVQAMIAAKEKEIPVIFLTGLEYSVLSEHLGETDMVLSLPSPLADRVLELQLVVLHGLCEVIDQTIFQQILE
ncbi:MAG: SIS domain-containing protein [Gammaproteobacteria bacterium]|nr:SIS domain-containing protein [Gammaproteobacteria bacterium]